MKRSDIKEIPAYYGEYINLNEDIELADAFSKSLNQIDNLDIRQLERIGLKTYAAGKWSVNKIIQHITDWERIWCYRTILAVRKEGSTPEAHEENIMAVNSNADELPVRQVIAELRAVRLATIAMFETFNNDLMLTQCRFSNSGMSILAMGFNIIGHQLHHFKIIKERYMILDKDNMQSAPL